MKTGTINLYYSIFELGKVWRLKKGWSPVRPPAIIVEVIMPLGRPCLASNWLKACTGDGMTTPPMSNVTALGLTAWLLLSLHGNRNSGRALSLWTLLNCVSWRIMVHCYVISYDKRNKQTKFNEVCPKFVAAGIVSYCIQYSLGNVKSKKLKYRGVAEICQTYYMYNKQMFTAELKYSIGDIVGVQIQLSECKLSRFHIGYHTRLNFR